jgi:hypothetical protein
MPCRHRSNATARIGSRHASQSGEDLAGDAAGGDERGLGMPAASGLAAQPLPHRPGKAERASALAERLDNVNAAAKELGTTWLSLRKAFTRHRLGMPARNPHQSNATWAAVGDNGHIGNGRCLVADGRSGATGMGGSSVDYRDRSDSGEERVTQQMAPTLF